MCIVIPVERGLFMHGVLGPLLLVLLVGILVSPIYAILKFKKPINKVLFIVSILIAAIIFSQVIYGEFFLIGDPGVAPSANESHFFALSILGSFFITISFSVLGIVYWRENERPNKMMVFTFFIIAIIPIIGLMIGVLPRGAEA
jgi:magnesium-transporting ATPase (P-type)